MTGNGMDRGPSAPERRPGRDERTLTGRHRTCGYLGPWSSSFTFAWLATHRDRLQTLILGGKRLSMLFVWDSRGAEPVHRSEQEIEAVRTIVLGPMAAADPAEPCSLCGGYGAINEVTRKPVPCMACGRESAGMVLVAVDVFDQAEPGQQRGGLRVLEGGRSAADVAAASEARPDPEVDGDPS